jgi:hypothetical protein
MDNLPIKHSFYALCEKINKNKETAKYTTLVNIIFCLYIREI